jgi:uncharacterized membrane protein YcaP (DUF421 family)
MFFQSWSALARVIFVTTVIFVVVVTMLRVVGQQALAKMSGYDVLVTVSFGSIVASVILMHNVTISEAVTALVTLVALQEGTRRAQSRWLPAHHLVREPPRLVLWDGQLLEDRLLETSTSADEVRAAVRKRGMRSLSDARAVVLENDGEWSVVPKSDEPSDESALFGLKIPGSELSSVESPARASPHRLP